MTASLARSVQTRLVRHAHTLGIDPNVVLARYAAERLLYRLSCSPQAERFVLKGALMLLVWLGEAVRATRDADVLGFGAVDADSLRETFSERCTLHVEADGLEFDSASLRVAPIRVEDAYGGQRVLLVAHLGDARLRLTSPLPVVDRAAPGGDAVRRMEASMRPEIYGWAESDETIARSRADDASGACPGQSISTHAAS